MSTGMTNGEFFAAVNGIQIGILLVILFWIMLIARRIR